MASNFETNVSAVSTGNGDINDVFDDIFLSEDRIYKEEYEEGVKKGEEDGLLDGFHLGYHRGAEIGAEIGYYVGILEASLAAAKKENVNLSDSLTSNIHRVLEALKTFPRTNTNEVDIIKLFENIKAQYKRVCSLLKINGSFPEKPKLTF